MNSFYQLFLANLKMFVREKEGFYWTVIMPAIIYVALAVIPIGRFINTSSAYPSFLLPGLIAMTVMQGGIYSLAYWMVDLKSRGVIKRLLAAPIKQWQLALSLVAARLLVVVAQVVILTLLGIFAFHAEFAGNYLSILIFILLGGGIFLMIGLLISNYAKSYDAAAPLTSAVGLPLPFLSSVFYPLELLPRALQVAAKFLPMYYFSDGLRQAYLYPFNFSVISKDVAMLFLWFCLALTVTLLFFRLKES